MLLLIFLPSCSAIQLIIYCNGFGQRIGRQQLCKHSPTHSNNRGSSVFRVHGDVTTVGSSHVTCVCCMFVELAPMDWLDSDHMTCFL
jgi:hypothetical protein